MVGHDNKPISVVPTSKSRILRLEKYDFLLLNFMWYTLSVAPKVS
jgi:hypothetical protein